jgi:hypothetical protein
VSPADAVLLAGYVMAVPFTLFVPGFLRLWRRREPWVFLTAQAGALLIALGWAAKGSTPAAVGNGLWCLGLGVAWWREGRKRAARPPRLAHPSPGPRETVDIGFYDAVNFRGEQSVWLTPDEILVLIGWCDRMEREDDYEHVVVDEGERAALWALSTALDSQSADIFAADYDERLAAARERLRPQDS